MAAYFYSTDGQQHGPVTMDQLDEMISSGSLAPDTFVWTDGMADWQPYSSLAAPSPSLAAPAPAALSLSNPAVAEDVTCTVCQHAYPAELTIRHGASTVCSICKDQFFASLAQPASASGDYASILRRVLARVIDFAVMVVAGFACLVLGSFLDSVAAPKTAEGFGLLLLSKGLLYFTTLVGYQVFFHGKWGQTLGKMAVKIKVVAPDGGSISYFRAAGRLISEMITNFFTFGLGLLTALFDRQKRTLHDHLAGTRVVNVG